MFYWFLRQEASSVHSWMYFLQIKVGGKMHTPPIKLQARLRMPLKMIPCCSHHADCNRPHPSSQRAALFSKIVDGTSSRVERFFPAVNAPARLGALWIVVGWIGWWRCGWTCPNFRPLPWCLKSHFRETLASISIAAISRKSNWYATLCSNYASRLSKTATWAHDLIQWWVWRPSRE